MTRRQRWVKGIEWLICVAGIVGLCGCGGGNTTPKSDVPTTKVSGSLSYRNKPLKAGEVIISAQGSNQVVAVGVQEDGSFVAEKAPVGPVIVSVSFPPRPPEWDIPNAPIPPTDNEDLKKQMQLMASLKPLPRKYFENNDVTFKYTLKQDVDNTIKLVLP